jgi:hypothetical protein
MPTVSDVLKVGNGELLIKAKAQGRQVNGQVGVTDVYVHVKPTNEKIGKGDQVSWHDTKVTVTQASTGRSIVLERHFPQEKK